MDKETVKRQTGGTWRFLGEVMAGKKGSIVILLVVQAALGISSIFYALFLREIINAAVEGDRGSFFQSVAGFALLVCGMLLLRALLHYLEEEVRSSLENRLKQRLFAVLFEKDYAYVSVVHSAEWMNRLTSDTVIAANGLTEILPGAAGMAVKLLGALAALVVLVPEFLYLIVPAGLLLAGFSYAFRTVMKRLHKNVQEQDGKLRVFLQESLEGMSVVHAYGVEAAVEDLAVEKMRRHKKSRIRRNHFSNFCNLGFGALMNGAYVLGALFCGYGILTKTMSYGTFLAVLQLIGQVQAPFANISGFLPRYYAMMASCERLMEAEGERDRIAGGAGEGEAAWAQGALAQGASEQGASAQGLQIQEIGLQHVCFSYAKESAPVLDDFSLTIQRGEFVAFTGRSGCGKSTVLKLLMCLYDPQAGERYLRCQGESRALDGRCRKLFAYVPQGNHLMSGTVREVVAFADREAISDEERVKKALEIACCGFVYELHEGLDTMVGERGLGFSEGQMQRLAIARAVFSGNPVLLLDEATSALDEETEEQVLRNLRAMTEKTVLIVTHRRAALSICDRVVEMGLRTDEREG